MLNALPTCIVPKLFLGLVSDTAAKVSCFLTTIFQSIQTAVTTTILCHHQPSKPATVMYILFIILQFLSIVRNKWNSISGTESSYIHQSVSDFSKYFLNIEIVF